MCNIDNLYSSLFENYYFVRDIANQFNINFAKIEKILDGCKVTKPPILEILQFDRPTLTESIKNMHKNIKDMVFRLDKLQESFDLLQCYREEEKGGDDDETH